MTKEKNERPGSSNQRPNAGAIIVAAGSSRRMEGSDKLWSPLADASGNSRPLLAYPLGTFQACSLVTSIVLVVAEGARDRARELARDERADKVCAIVQGGERRQDSVRAGLEALGECRWVIVHDAARPLITADLIEQGLEVAQETGASTTALPAPDTVKESEDGTVVTRTLDRSRLWLTQTPQTFACDLLLEAHRRSSGDVTDDAALVEAMGVKVRLYAGSSRNLKVTTPEDLVVVQALLAHSS